MIIDLDIYYNCWLLIKELRKNCTIPIKLKLHSLDTVTIKILDYFSIKEIEIISKIDTIPQFAIVLNSTINFELKEFTNVLNFTSDTNLKSILVALQESEKTVKTSM